MRGARRTVVVLATVATLLSSSVIANASSTPASAAQVKALVGASHTINRLSASLAKKLTSSRYDLPAKMYPIVGPIGTDNCVTTTACVFGDLSAKTTIVLFGDSHAYMWLPAMVPAATTLHERLVLVWQPACAVAALAPFYYAGSTVNIACPSWRSEMIAAISALKPKLVVIGERTAQVLSVATAKAFTSAQWRSALVSTISKLHSTTTKVAVLEDLAFFNDATPQSCVAAYPTKIQAKCSIPTPNPTNPGQQVAEKAAAGYGGTAAVFRATGVARSTIIRGAKDLLATSTTTVRVRRKGAGRPLSSKADPTVLDDLRRLVEPATMGDPMREVDPGFGTIG